MNERNVTFKDQQAKELFEKYAQQRKIVFSCPVELSCESIEALWQQMERDDPDRRRDMVYTPIVKNAQVLSFKKS